jgi:hypothetical protein
MHKEKQKEKHMGGKDSELVPNKSYGNFILGDEIKKYLLFPHTVNYIKEALYNYYSYHFHNDTVIIWTTEDNRIETIRCISKCYWRNQNLIGMQYEDFLVLVAQLPDSESIGYDPISPEQKQKQSVYEFTVLGLQIWVWRKKIKSILISRYNDIENYLLIPNKSLGRFTIGDNIEKYLHLNHLTGHSDMKTSYNSYYFYNETVGIWTTENNKIETIRCDTKCYWQSHNIIGMLYNDFEILANQQPDEEDTLYVPISSDRGQNQKVYNFSNLGLMLWVWRKKIRTVLISKYDKEE